MSAQRTRRTHTTRRRVGRTAALFAVGTLASVGATLGVTSAAGALTPMPEPGDLPIAVGTLPTIPPVVPPVVDGPDEPGPGDGAPDEVALPDEPLPDPMPDDLPEVADMPEDDDVDPDPGDDPEPGDGPELDGPDGLSTGEVPPPTEHPDPTVPDTTVDDVEPAPEVLDESASVAETPADELAFTGTDLSLVTAGAALLTAGALAGGAALVARRRRSTDEAAELA